MEKEPPRKPYPTDVSDEWAFVAPHLVALVRAGAKFEKGVLVERPDQAANEVAA